MERVPGLKVTHAVCPLPNCGERALEPVDEAMIEDRKALDLIDLHFLSLAQCRACRAVIVSDPISGKAFAFVPSRGRRLSARDLSMAQVNTALRYLGNGKPRSINEVLALTEHRRKARAARQAAEDKPGRGNPRAR